MRHFRVIFHIEELLGPEEKRHETVQLVCGRQQVDLSIDTTDLVVPPDIDAIAMRAGYDDEQRKLLTPAWRNVRLQLEAALYTVLRFSQTKIFERVKVTQ